MSPLQRLLQSFGQMLPPGSTIYVLAAELPDGRTLMNAGVSLESAGERCVQPLSAAPRASGITPVARVAAVRAEHGPDAALKLRDWSRELGISLKELRRAVRSGALPHEAKPDGRDNKAHTVTAGVMERYLKTVDAVEAELQEAPTWWSDVRGSRAT